MYNNGRTWDILVNPKQRKMMLHAIGWDNASQYTRNGTRYFKPYRNYYDAGGNDVADWDYLVQNKLAEKGTSYHVTALGLVVLSDIMETYIYSDNARCVADAKEVVVDILIADACVCGYGCWIPSGAEHIAKLGRLPKTLTLKTLHYLADKGIVAKTYYGDIDDDGYPHCYHGWILTAKGREVYKERYDKAWKEECEYINNILSHAERIDNDNERKGKTV